MRASHNPCPALGRETPRRALRLISRFRRYRADNKLAHNDESVKLWDDIERAIVVASTVERHLPAVRAAIGPPIPKRGLTFTSPDFEDASQRMALDLVAKLKQ
jgi:hypothetical protein